MGIVPEKREIMRGRIKTLDAFKDAISSSGRTALLLERVDEEDIAARCRFDMRLSGAGHIEEIYLKDARPVCAPLRQNYVGRKVRGSIRDRPPKLQNLTMDELRAPYTLRGKQFQDAVSGKNANSARKTRLHHRAQQNVGRRPCPDDRITCS